jgi:hypothetical protein
MMRRCSAQAIDLFLELTAVMFMVTMAKASHKQAKAAAGSVDRPATKRLVAACAHNPAGEALAEPPRPRIE